MKSLTVGQRIVTGFAVILVLLGGVSLWSIFGIRGIVGNSEEVIDGNKLRGDIVQKEVDHLNWAKQVNTLLTDDSVTELKVQTDHTKCAFGKWYYGEGRKEAEKLVPELRPILLSIDEPHKHLHESAIKINEVFQQIDTQMGSFLREKKGDHLEWMHKLKDALIHTEIKEVNVEFDHTKCSLGKWLLSDEVHAMEKSDPQFKVMIDKVKVPHKHLHESGSRFNEFVKEGDHESASKIYTEQVENYANQTLADIDDIIVWHDEHLDAMNEADKIYAQETQPNLDKVQGLLNKIVETTNNNIMTDDQMLSSARSTNYVVIIVSIITGLLGMFLAIVIARGIVGPLRELIGGLSEGAVQVSSASSQVSSSSQSLAEGSAEQASSLEETSSSLEELTSMTRQNADNAEQANTLAKNANDAAIKGNQETKRMIEAMKKISDSASETQKIIKTIDEIAFQTNLLALNAAVEAARAGDAGKGFAVVAEEVRNLAQRAGEAARNTTELIEGSVDNTNNGVAIADGMAEALSEIINGTQKARDLVAEITAASKEQAQGIDQINVTVGEMDRVTQQNASNAEESASASEELNAQAESMHDMVEELTRLVGGAGVEHGQTSFNGNSRASTIGHHGNHKGQHKATRSVDNHQLARSKNEEKSLERAIPFDDDSDFKEF